MSSQVLLDCTLRDGGYYNSWDFNDSLIHDYLLAMKAVRVDVVELGFRSTDKKGFKGACAYSTDAFIRTLDVFVFTSPIPAQLKGLAIEYPRPYWEFAERAKYSTANFWNP